MDQHYVHFRSPTGYQTNQRAILKKRSPASSEIFLLASHSKGWAAEFSLPSGGAFSHIAGVDTVKLKLTMAYAGWQVQKTGVAIQQQVEEVLARFFPSAPQVHSSSRTDAGAHALGLVAHVEIPKREFKMTPYKLVLALNAFLPEDIRIIAATRSPAAFHARFDASGKPYRYYVCNHMATNPLLRRLSWHVPVPLDLAAVRATARALWAGWDRLHFLRKRP